MLVSTIKFFKDEEIAWARSAGAICCLWKIYKYLHQIAPVIMFLLVNTLHEKRVTESQNKQNFAARALIVICTRVTTLHSCYMKNALVFSQKNINK